MPSHECKNAPKQQADSRGDDQLDQQTCGYPGGKSNFRNIQGLAAYSKRQSTRAGAPIHLHE